jgi:hypothetical protein
MKEIGEDTIKSCAHGLEELITLKCAFCPKQFRDLMETLSKGQSIIHIPKKKKS